MVDCITRHDNDAAEHKQKEEEAINSTKSTEESGIS